MMKFLNVLFWIRNLDVRYLALDDPTTGQPPASLQRPNTGRMFQNILPPGAVLQSQLYLEYLVRVHSWNMLSWLGEARLGKVNKKFLVYFSTDH